MRSALLGWGHYFDPDHVEPSPLDPYGYHQLGSGHNYPNKRDPSDANYPTDHNPSEHRWARAPVPLPSVLLRWLRDELVQQFWVWPTTAATSSKGGCGLEHAYAELELDDDELEAVDAVSEVDEATWEADLEQALAEEPLPPSPATVKARWWQLSRAEKATARLLDFRFHNWHQKQITIACTWLELCDEEQAAARRLGFDAAQWDAHAPESIIVPVLSLAQLLSAQQFLAAQLKQTRAAAQQLRQVCMHPFNASIRF